MAKHVFNVAAAALCLLCATALPIAAQNSSATDCFVSITATDTQTGAETSRCALATVGVTSATCQAAGKPNVESTLYDPTTLICSVPIPYDCGNLAVTGRVGDCSDSVGSSVIALNKQATNANFYGTALQTNGNTLKAGGTLLTATGAAVRYAPGAPAAAPQSQSGSTFTGGATPASPTGTSSPASTAPPTSTGGNTGSTFTG